MHTEDNKIEKIWDDGRHGTQGTMNTVNYNKQRNISSQRQDEKCSNE